MMLFCFFYQGRQDGEPESKKASIDGGIEEKHRLVHLIINKNTILGFF